jgi:hypothetical protein
MNVGVRGSRFCFIGRRLLEQSYKRRELSPEERDNAFSWAVIPSEKWRSGFSLKRPIWCEAEIYKDVTNTDKGLE